MRIVLAQAPWYGDNWHGVRAGSRWPFIFDSPKPAENSIGGYTPMPFFLSYAANYLIHRGIEVGYYDALSNHHTYETFYKVIADFKPDIVLMETSTPSIQSDLECAKKLKEMGMEVALAGPHATTYAHELIKDVDYVLKGEYEINSYEMCLMRKKGVYECRPLMKLDGAYPYRDNTCYRYSDGFLQDQFIEQPQLMMWTSRGCPYKCNFCLWNSTMTHGYRQRSVRDVMRELGYCMKTFGFKSVLFDDDTFNVGDKRTKEISAAMGSMNIQWHAMVRSDACSLSAYEDMLANGCVGLKLGVETFSQKGLDYLNKNMNAQESIYIIEHLLKMGFKCFLSFMDNIPVETDDDRKYTEEIKQHFIDMGASIQHPNCMPLPGTELHKSLDTTDDWFDYGKFHGEVINA